MSNGVNTAISDAQRVKVGDTGSTISITLQNTEGDAVTAVQWIRAYSSATINPEQYVDIPSYDVVDGVIYLQLPEIERGEYNIEIKDEDGRIYPAEGAIKLTMVSSTKDAGEVYYVTYREMILEDVTPIITSYLAENPDGFKGDKGDQGDKGNDGTDGADGIDGENLKYEDLTPEQKEEMIQGMSVRPPKIYTRAEYDALVSFDPHDLYFVVEEEDYGMPL